MRPLIAILPFLLSAGAVLAQTARPNILWITSEDNGPHLGAYGDSYAVTPNLDKLANRGLRYTNAWSNAPVCAPARTTIISGLYPFSTGAEHMRSMINLPKGFKMYPQYLREAGYYCTNNVKEDYNLEKPGKVWDDSSRTAHWRNRKPGQPFFAIFNFTVSHESQIRVRPHTLKHDPSKVRIPAYHPDTPEVRHDWAQYYDKITEMDAQAGEVLAQLQADGLVDDTIIFYYGDHGSGMPRSKRWPYNSGLNVPMIVVVPPKFQNLQPEGYKAGAASDRLVAFIDLAPTVLSIAGVKPPAEWQGHAFLGRYSTPPQPYLYGFRGRMDERYDLVRTMRDKRYVYIRNFMPHKIYGQHIDYMFQTPTTQVWKSLYDQHKLKPPQTYFWETKQPEELYDLTQDPDEVHNLAASQAHRETLLRFRGALHDFLMKARDVGFLPEDEIHKRAEGSSPWQVGHDPAKYPLDRILPMAEKASFLEPKAVPDLKQGLKDPDSAVRYWAALGFLMRGKAGLAAGGGDLEAALADRSPSVRIIAAEAFGRYGTDAQASKALEILLELAPMDRNGVYLSMLALNAIDAMGERARPARDRIAALPKKLPGLDDRLTSYVPRLIEDIVASLKGS